MKKYRKITRLLFVILVGMWICTGCSDEKQTGDIPQTEQESQEDQTPEHPENEAESQSPEHPKNEEPIQEETVDQLSDTSTDTPSDEAELSVVVESIGDNSVVGNKMFIESDAGGNSEIVMVGIGEDNKTLISVHFTEDTTYVYYIIRDGGANVETREGSFSDIKVGLILDMNGRFEDDDFWAEKVEINDVRNN